MSALENAYKNSIMVGKVPACVMHIDLPAEAVDVNVHPAKTEVRFANEKAVFDAVYFACKNALMEKDTPKEVSFEKKDYLKKQPQPQQQPLAAVTAVHSKPKEDFWQQKSAAAFTNEAEETPKESAPAPKKAETQAADIAQLQTAAAEPPVYRSKRVNIDIDFDEAPASQPPVSPTVQEAPPVAQSEAEAAPAEQVQEKATVEPLEVIGEVFKTSIIVQRGNEVLFIDKRAARGRILFEQLKADAHADPQMLMEPMNVVLSKEDYDAVITNAALLEKSGFIVEDFGAGTCIVRAYPMVLENADMKEVLEETAGYLRQHKKDFESEALDWLYHNVACRAAIKAGNFTSRFEMERFVEKLLSMPDIRYCPHGRPVMIVMSKYQFEKQFGRV